MMSEVHPTPCRGAPASSSERRQWERIFRALTEMLRQRQELIDTLAGDRELLQNYVLTQHTRWESKTRGLESRIAKMKKACESTQNAFAAKLDLVVGVKQTEISRCKEQFGNSESSFSSRNLESSEDDLQQFEECVEALKGEISHLKGHIEEIKSKEPRSNSNSKNWRQAYKELNTKKEAEISALLAEKDFVWHQFKKMEEEYTRILKTKQIEIAQANEAVEKIRKTMEKFKSSDAEKDEMISNLREKLSKVEASKNEEEAKKLRLMVKDKEMVIAKLQRELARTEASSRKPGSRLLRCSGEMGSMRRSDSGQRVNSKRKSMTSMQSLDSPKLFSSSFKVPKLRHPSPGF